MRVMPSAETIIELLAKGADDAARSSSMRW
jgi:hypothetical protein